jgi:hypothetical protein
VDVVAAAKQGVMLALPRMAHGLAPAFQYEIKWRLQVIDRALK